MKRLVLISMIPTVGLLTAGAAIHDSFVGDLYLAGALQKVTAAPWEWTMETVTFIGRAPLLIAFALPMVAWFLWKRKRAEALTLSMGLLSFAVTPGLKVLVDRPRPSDDLVTVWGNYGGLGFPSGHAFDAMVLFGLLFYLAPLLVSFKPAVHMVRVSSLSLILLIGISRVYLGAHWPSDVLGGFMYGAIALVFLTHLHHLLMGAQSGLQRPDPRVTVGQVASD